MALRGDSPPSGPTGGAALQSGEPSPRQRAAWPSGVAGATWHATTLGERERAAKREEGGRR
jgi:hypothetical protein